MTAYLVLEEIGWLDKFDFSLHQSSIYKRCIDPSSEEVITATIVCALKDDVFTELELVIVVRLTFIYLQLL